MLKNRSSVAPSGTMALGIPSRGVCHSHFTRSLTDLAIWDMRYGRQHLHPDVPTVWVIGATQIVNSRNTIVQQFLANTDGAEWLVFLDDDQVYPLNLLEILAESIDRNDRRIVGIPVWRFASQDAGPVRVTHNVFDLHESGAFVEWTDPLPENAVMQVAAVGTGCMAVHRSVFEEMRDHSKANGTGERWCWFRHVVYQPADLAEGEDLGFCRYALALGIPVWVNTSLTLSHLKTIQLDGPLPEGALTL